MRRVGLSLFGCMAVVAFVGLSAPAFATHDPGCDPYNNDVGIFEFTVDTPDSHKEHAVSGVTGSGYACGSDIWWPNGGKGSLYNHADIGVPPGVEIADSDSVPNGSWAATATVNVLYHLLTFPNFQADVVSDVRTDSKSACIYERDNEIVGDTPQGTIVSCLHGYNWLGESWNWSTLDQNGKLWLTLGPMHGLAGVEPGLTYVNLDLCGYYGDAGVDCGGPGDQFQQKNGDATRPSPAFMGWCDSQYQWDETGVYTITATMNNGTVTPEASTTVEWDHVPCSSSKLSK